MRGVGAHGRDHPRQVGSSLGGLIRGMATNSAQLSTFDTLGASAALGLQAKRPEVSSDDGCELPLRVAAQPVWSEQGGSSGGPRPRSAPRRPLRLRSTKPGSHRSCPIRATIAPAAERQSKRPRPQPVRRSADPAPTPTISSTGSAAGCAASEQAERGDRWSATPQAASCRCLDNLGWDLVACAGEEHAAPLLHADASLCSFLRLASDENSCRTKAVRNGRPGRTVEWRATAFTAQTALSASLTREGLTSGSPPALQSGPSRLPES